MELDQKQPIPRPGRRPGIPQYQAGGKRSVSRLANLGYDPIKELVDTSAYLKMEIKRWEDIRDGKLTVILGENRDGTAKTLNYSWMAHHTLIDKLIAVGEKLLRYGYGRVPETEEAQPKGNRLGLTVKLTKPGEVMVFNTPANEEAEERDPLADDTTDYGAMDVEFQEK